MKTVALAPKEAASNAQRDFYIDDVNRYPAFCGGFGSGKTYSGLCKCLRLSYINPKSNGLIITPTYDLLAKVLWIKLEEILNEMDLMQKCHFVKSPTKYLKLPWGPIWFFYTGERPRSIVGSEVAWAYLDEAGLMNELCWQNADARVRCNKANVLQSFCTFTPEVPGWTHNKWGTKEIYGKELQPGYVVYQPDPSEDKTRHPYNPFLTRKYYEDQCRQWGDEEAASRVHGRFYASRSGKAYYAFGPENIKECKYNPTLPLYISFDFNQTPGMHAEILQTDGIRLYFIDEIFRKGLLVEGCCDEILKRYNTHMKDVIITGDASGTHSASNRTDYHIIEELLVGGTGQHRGFIKGIEMKTKRTNPPVSDRVSNFNRLLKDSTGYRHIYIDPKCVRLRADLEGLLTIGKKAELSGRSAPLHNANHPDKTDQNLSHASDAAGYLLYLLEPPQGSWMRITDFEEWQLPQN